MATCVIKEERKKSNGGRTWSDQGLLETGMPASMQESGLQDGYLDLDPNIPFVMSALKPYYPRGGYLVQ